MGQIPSSKLYDLEERTLSFAKSVILLCNTLKNNTVNFQLIDQLIRSSSSIGTNYREANDAISKKDFIHRLRISRKEAKETSFWLELVVTANPDITSGIDGIKDECIQLRNILSSIIKKQESKL